MLPHVIMLFKARSNGLEFCALQVQRLLFWNTSIRLGLHRSNLWNMFL